MPLCEMQQLTLFSEENAPVQSADQMHREQRKQLAILAIQQKYGKNAILKGMNLEEHATAMDRNMQIGGHKA